MIEQQFVHEECRSLLLCDSNSRTHVDTGREKPWLTVREMLSHHDMTLHIEESILSHFLLALPEAGAGIA